LADERAQTRKQLFVGEVLEIHRSLLPSRISSSGLARQRTIRRMQASKPLPRANDVGEACGAPHHTFAARPANVSARVARASSTQIDIGLTFLRDGSELTDRLPFT
jgi:hypothetical protein